MGIEISEKKQEMIKAIIAEMTANQETAHVSYRNFMTFLSNVRFGIRKLEDVKTEINTERILSQTPDLPGL